MKRFDNFGEYMFDLLFGPLKKGKRAVNQFFIFFKVVGRQFDDVKRAFFQVREEANVVSCSEIMLPVHGQDREMPRLEGEDAEGYRTRLSMKGIISEWGGTRQGILYVLTALGYEQSRIEPVAYDIPEKWAEFIVFLKGEKQSGVINLDVIDKEVRKVKEGSSRPFYGLEAGECHRVPLQAGARLFRLPPLWGACLRRLADHRSRGPSICLRSGDGGRQRLRRRGVPEGGHLRGLDGLLGFRALC